MSSALELSFALVVAVAAEPLPDGAATRFDNHRITSLCVTEDGMVASAGADHTVRKWDPRTGKELWRAAFANTVLVGPATKDTVVAQETSAGKNGPAVLLDRATGQAKSFQGKLGSVVGKSAAEPETILTIAPNGKAILTLAGTPPALKVWSLPTGNLIGSLSLTAPDSLTFSRCAAAQFTADATSVVTVVEHRDLKAKGTKSQTRAFVERWEITSGKLHMRMAATPGHLPLLLPGPEGPCALIGSEVRDMATDEVLMRFPKPSPGGVDTVGLLAALSADRRVLALSFPRRDDVSLFEVWTGRLRNDVNPNQHKYPGKGHSPSVMCFLRDGRLVTAENVALVWNVWLRQRQISGSNTNERCWELLSNADARYVWSDMEVLANRGAEAVEFLRGKLKRVPPIDETAVAKLVAALDASGFKEREAASAELDKLGPVVAGRVRTLMARGLSEEALARAERYLTKHGWAEPQAEELQALRASEVLEAIGTKEARKVLEELASGEPTARLTRDAASAVRRLGGR